VWVFVWRTLFPVSGTFKFQQQGNHVKSGKSIGNSSVRLPHDICGCRRPHIRPNPPYAISDKERRTLRGSFHILLLNKSAAHVWKKDAALISLLYATTVVFRLVFEAGAFESRCVIISMKRKEKMSEDVSTILKSET
jgi:hypothetical protein